MIEIKDVKELEKYYDQKTNTYIFQDDVYFRINIKIDANINACNIKACDIDAWDINACDIDACDINAWDINYYAICIAYHTFKCKSLVGIRKNAKAICLDSEVFVEEKEENATK